MLTTVKQILQGVKLSLQGFSISLNNENVKKSTRKNLITQLIISAVVLLIVFILYTIVMVFLNFHVVPAILLGVDTHWISLPWMGIFIEQLLWVIPIFQLFFLKICFKTDQEFFSVMSEDDLEISEYLASCKKQKLPGGRKYAEAMLKLWTFASRTLLLLMIKYLPTIYIYWGIAVFIGTTLFFSGLRYGFGLFHNVAFSFLTKQQKWLFRVIGIEPTILFVVVCLTCPDWIVSIVHRIIEFQMAFFVSANELMEPLFGRMTAHKEEKQDFIYMYKYMLMGFGALNYLLLGIPFVGVAFWKFSAGSAALLAKEIVQDKHIEQYLNKQESRIETNKEK